MYTGTRSIASLSAFPLSFHRNIKELSERLVTRGAKFESLAGSHYKGYNGIGWKLNQLGEKDKCAVKGRVIIDTYGWNRFNANNGVYVAPFTQKDLSNRALYDDIPPPNDDYEGGYDECDGGMPVDGAFADDDEENKFPELSYEQKLIATHLVRGYSLKEKLWCMLTFPSPSLSTVVLRKKCSGNPQQNFRSRARTLFRTKVKSRLQAYADLIQ